MSETFTKGMARNIYYGGSLFFVLVFLALTYHTERTIPERTNSDLLTESVIRGKLVCRRRSAALAVTACWVKVLTLRRSWVTCLSVVVVRKVLNTSYQRG